MREMARAFACVRVWSLRTGGSGFSGSVQKPLQKSAFLRGFSSPHPIDVVPYQLYSTFHSRLACSALLTHG
eukprot:1678528-Rhodomonas_salina.1